MRRAKRFLLGCLAVVAVILIGIGILFGKDIKNLWNSGYISAALSSPEDRTYNATTSAENLKAIYTAMMLYHESEGQLPKSEGWMDAIGNRMQTSDMKGEEAQKKLIRPNLLPPKPGVFGYAMNDACSGKYRGDIKDPKTPLIYDSVSTARNAHGNPAKDKLKGGAAIAVDGTILK